MKYVRRDANLTFCPFLPIAREKLSPSAITNASFLVKSVIATVNSFAGDNAFSINSAGSSLYLTTSNFSPCNSLIIPAILDPFSPIHAPIGSTFGLVE